MTDINTAQKVFVRVSMIDERKFDINDPVPADINPLIVEKLEKAGYIRPNPQYDHGAFIKALVAPYEQRVEELEKENQKLEGLLDGVGIKKGRKGTRRKTKQNASQNEPANDGKSI